MNWSAITHPTLLLDTTIAQRNLERMAAKARTSGTLFRPHFKTHQSATIGRWFKDVGVDHIAVSSANMAVYFACRGWHNILVSFPFHPAQWGWLRPLADSIDLQLLVAHQAGAAALAQLADRPVHVWLELDSGQGRTGLPMDEPALLQQVVTTLRANPKIRIKGVHIHAGQSYHCRGAQELKNLAADLLPRIAQLRQDWLTPESWALSFGDTPLCSYLQDLSFADEIRPGNFIFYDLMQHQIGACTPEDIAVAVACPVVDDYFVYGGAVHLSKDRLQVKGEKVFGAVATPTGTGWAIPSDIYQQPLTNLSQEHGWLSKTAPPLAYGTVVPVLPVHSCLTAEAMPYYLTTDGKRIEKCSTHLLA